MDDSHWHQTSSTFDHVATSDPRFFDRVWLAASSRDGTQTVHVTLGVYQNMNVVDAGCVVILDGVQHNVRASRELRPEFTTVCGPIGIEVVEPLHRVRITLEPGEHGISGELTWTSVVPPHEEPQHFRRVRGRVVEDYARFDQIGVCDGRLDVAGTRVEVADWWACRDHSWGVRERVGVPEPVTGADAPRAGGLFAFLFYSTDTHAGHAQVARGSTEYSSAGTTDRKTGMVVDGIPVTGISAAFSDGERPRRMTHVSLTLDTPGGPTRLDLDADRPAVAMPGLGYGGYRDGRGLGAYRGPAHIEHDRWDVRHPAVVGLPDGGTVRPSHRIQPVRVTQHNPDGTVAQGHGSLTFVAEGDLAALGIAPGGGTVGTGDRAGRGPNGR